MPSLFPEGLTQKQFNLLTQCAHTASNISATDLISSSKAYFEKISQAYAENMFINLRLSEVIYKNFCVVVDAWETLPEHSHPWVKGMIHYFCLSSDLEGDLISPIGFDDDVEVMNACLRLAGRDDLCLNPEDFDDV